MLAHRQKSDKRTMPLDRALSLIETLYLAKMYASKHDMQMYDITLSSEGMIAYFRQPLIGQSISIKWLINYIIIIIDESISSNHVL